MEHTPTQHPLKIDSIIYEGMDVWRLKTLDLKDKTLTEQDPNSILQKTVRNMNDAIKIHPQSLKRKIINSDKPIFEDGKIVPCRKMNIKSLSEEKIVFEDSKDGEIVFKKDSSIDDEYHTIQSLQNHLNMTIFLTNCQTE